jgi:predicted porin
LALVTVVSLSSAGLASSPASASETAKAVSQTPATGAPTSSPTPAPARNAQISNLEAQIQALKAQLDPLKAQLDLIESQQEEQARQTSVKAENAKKDPGVHIVETSGTDVRLYALLEATLAGMTHTNGSGQSSIGMPVSWFSGNRWGIDVVQRLSAPGTGIGVGVDTSKNLNFIAKLESEFELPSGNMDTPGVLFNRDAWIGLQGANFGKLTVGRQNALPRDVAQIWGDPYSPAAITTNEGGFSNVNNFKQMIYYAGGGNGANGQGDTRYDSAIVWKKLFRNGLFLSAAYDFADANGPGGPNGTGPIPGAHFNLGSTAAGGIGYNAGRFHTTAFYTTTNVLEPKTIGATNIGHQARSFGVGGNFDTGRYRFNGGFMYYTGDQGALGRRNDKAWTASTKITLSKQLDYELGVQEFYAQNAAVSTNGFVLRPYTSAVGAPGTISGTRFTTYGSVIYHWIPNLDLYLVGDNLLTGGGYLDSRANGAKHVTEIGTGARYKF